MAFDSARRAWEPDLSAIGCAAVVESDNWIVSGKPLAKKLPLALIHLKYQAKIPCTNDRHCLLIFAWTVIARGKGMLKSTPHSRQLRTGRYSGHHQLYLLTTIVHCRSPLFADWRMGRLVVDQFRLAEAEGAAHSLAWVVMPDHFHWLIELRDSSLSALMRRAKSRSAHSINHALGRQCQVWQKGFHDRALRSEEDIKGIARYVVANPLRAGLVKRIGDYPLWDAIWLP
jgi:REP element-mobilizing transposase RayT